MMKLSLPKKGILFILPTAYLVLAFVFLHEVRAFYISLSDPSYAYLLNGTNLASGNLRVDIPSHPGTPVEIFAGIVIFIKHLFSGNSILYQDVLLHPESYLFTCGVVLALLLSVVTYFAGTSVFEHSGNMGIALLFQSAPLFFNDIVKTTVSLSAESGIIICGVFFTAYLYNNTIGLNENNKTTTNKNIVLFGLFTAILFTIKVYCAPVIILVLFILKKNKQRILYLASYGIFSLMLLAPIYIQFRNWAGTIKSVLLHKGAYGQGSAGVINAALYKNNLIEIFSTHYIFSTVYIISIMAFLTNLWLILKKRNDSARLISPITGIVIFFSLFVLIIAKQYKVIYPEPLTHQEIIIIKYYYFIPLIILFPFFIAVSYKVFSSLLLSFPFFRIYKRKLFYGLLIVFITCSGYRTYISCYSVRNNQNVALDKTHQFLSKWKNTPLIIVSDGNKACMETGLFFSLAYAGKWDASKYTDFVKKEYPNTYLYITYEDNLIFWDHTVDISTILKKNNQALIYFSATDSLSQAIILSRICNGTPQKKNIAYSKIYTSANRYENIYLLKPDSL